jgi:hypothetical protein
MQPLKFIQPSQVFYWEKCPLKAVFSAEYKDRPLFPKHPDSELGSLIHLFIQNKKEWAITSEESFEKKWRAEIEKIDCAYLANKLQKVYYPIKWHSKYFSVKKIHLKKSLLDSKKPKSRSSFNVLREEWRDDGRDIGGKIDYLILNEKKEVIEIGDTKTGTIFELIEKKKVIKEAYIKQIQLYAYIIKTKQDFYPKCFIKDIKGNKYAVEINDNIVKDEMRKAIGLKKKINKSLEDSDYNSLANPVLDHCLICDYRPVCDEYKKKYINNFDSNRVDIFGNVIKINGHEKRNITVQVESKILLLKGILCSENIKIGDRIFVYNLFCPDGESHILYAMKQTIIKNE